MDGVTLGDTLIKEYVNLRKYIKSESRSGASPLGFRVQMLKRVLSMVPLMYVINWYKPDMLMNPIVGSLTTWNIMLLIIVFETVRFCLDGTWTAMMIITNRVFGIIDYVTRFPPIDFPEDKEEEDI